MQSQKQPDTSKSYTIKNAIIMAAGLSSRFVPLSYEYPKALITVKGEVLIERQIRQLQEAGIKDITIVIGYKREMFHYLADKFQVTLIDNPDYISRNNHSSLYHAREKLRNTYICSADNYFNKNVFENSSENAYYSSVYHQGKTDEWCLETDSKGLITDVCVGGSDCWVMMGHVFFSEAVSNTIKPILEDVYHREESADLLWEAVYREHIKELPLFIRKYPDGIIFEFDSLAELRLFDKHYNKKTGSPIIQEICSKLNCKESDVIQIKPLDKKQTSKGFQFVVKGERYHYYYNTKELLLII